MSRRVTRSSARHSADLSASIQDPSPPEPPQLAPPDARPSSSRKRKASASHILPDDNEALATEPPPSRKKRPKTAEPAVGTTSVQSSARKKKRTSQNAVMSSPGEQRPEHTEPTSPPGPSASSKKKSKSKESTSSSKRRSSGGKKSKKAKEPVTPGTAEPPPPPPPPPADTDPPAPQSDDDEDEVERERQRQMDEADAMEEAMESHILSRHGAGGYRAAFAGLMSGTSSNLRNILENLRKNDSPDEQYIALTSLSELLLISTEDNLAGTFSPDSFLKELIRLMQPGDFGENQEMMLLACRCVANMMEALPTSTASVVYGGAVPVLVSKLLEIHYMDLAEQALITLEKISTEFPASIVREGGLTACLTYLDFFATSVQRTAVTTAANCCRSIPEDSFSTVKEVMPILLTTLNSSDQRVVEQGCLCVSRIVESFKYMDDKIEELMSTELLKAILRLLLPTSTNMISSNIHTQFLRVLSSTARASPQLTADLFRLNVVETLYQILTGVSPPTGTEDVAQKIDSVVIMQALIHRPREQIFETLTVICELLPALEPGTASFVSELASLTSHDLGTRGPQDKRDRRMQLLSECRDELRRFAVVLLPTLTDAYSSTVNLSVREKVVIAQLRMLSYLDTNILEDALRPVPYSSYLASMLSQQDHPVLVTAALQAAAFLIQRLDHIYRYQFHREGVVAEIRKLAERPLKVSQPDPVRRTPAASDVAPNAQGTIDRRIERAAEADSDDEGEDLGEGHEDDSESEDSETSPVRPTALDSTPDLQDAITGFAKHLIEEHDASKSGREARSRAEGILDTLRHLVIDIAKAYDAGNLPEGKALFTKLAKYFEGDALESVTSYELLDSKVVSTLLDVFQEPDGTPNGPARAAFIEVFMGSRRQNTIKTATISSPNTPFSILIQKLQDLLSRSEHFEVLTVHSNSFDSNRSSAASMLAKQLRVKLAADESSGIPAGFRHITVSIHAIANLKALDEYLRPRIALSERIPRRGGPGGMPGASIGGLDSASRSASGAGAPQSAGNGGPLGSAGSGDASTSQSDARRSKSKSKTEAAARDPSRPTSSDHKQSSSRQSSRRSKGRATRAETPPPPPSAPVEDENPSDALEVADEAHLSDQDDFDDEAHFDEVIEEFEEEDGDTPDPAAVSMEVADTGRVTATQDDGTRVDSPSSTPASSSRPPMPPAFPGSSARPSAHATAQALLSSISGRSMSYASALQQAPQNWHLEFAVNGQPISSETTIYRAIHFNQGANEDLSARNIWAQTHTIDFKRVEGPAPPESSLLATTPDPSTTESGTSLPLSLEKNPISAEILRLLRILHEINSNLDDLLANNRAAVKVNAEPVAQFVNTKLTAKLNRQLEEPLIVASNCLPTWSEDLARLYPFLFPFETRHLFLQSTSYGYSRSMSRWQNSQSVNDTHRHRHRDERPFLGRLQRQKVRISRDKIMESAFKVLELYGASPSILEVEYFDEVGTGLGPTLEFYSTVSKEFSKKKFKMWRENESTKGVEFAFGKQGLFPAPLSDGQLQKDFGRKVTNFFKLLGKFVARSMLDSRIIDVSFNPMFFRLASEVGPQPSTLNAIRTVDEDLARSLELIKKFVAAKKKIQDEPRLAPALRAQKLSRVRVNDVGVDDLVLDFTLPGHPHIELIPNGARTSVSIDNINVYLDKVIDYTLGRGVKKQIEAFKTGFSQVFPYNAMKAFTPEELVMLFGRNEEDWSVEALLDSTKADHGYNLDSKSVRNLMQAMSELGPEQRRDFLQFITGSPKLPIGGFRNLTPMFTVVCKPSEAPYSPDDYLPSVMTCVNYLKLPDYSSLDVMRQRLSVAIREGQGSFHLS